jgi:hypothetical protein
MLFFEVTHSQDGVFSARCHRPAINTVAADLAELHDKIISGVEGHYTAETMPELKDIKLIITRE